jgi:hypothetical protein
MYLSSGEGERRGEGGGGNGEIPLKWHERGESPACDVRDVIERRVAGITREDGVSGRRVAEVKAVATRAADVAVARLIAPFLKITPLERIGIINRADVVARSC